MYILRSCRILVVIHLLPLFFSFHFIFPLWLCVRYCVQPQQTGGKALLLYVCARPAMYRHIVSGLRRLAVVVFPPFNNSAAHRPGAGADRRTVKHSSPLWRYGERTHFPSETKWHTNIKFCDTRESPGYVRRNRKISQGLTGWDIWWYLNARPSVEGSQRHVDSEWRRCFGPNQ